jgi:hypothetical protein
MMPMNRQSDPFLENLVAELTPVVSMHPRTGIARTIGALLATIAALALMLGLRGHISTLFLLASGLFLLLGAAASWTVIAMARPQVGTIHTGWIWAAAMAALLPATTLVMGLPQVSSAWNASDPHEGILCLGMGVLSGLASGAVLVAWLRRGAPTSPERAGLITGIAAGSLGMFAYSLSCPLDGLYHIGLWHSLSVIASALLGRFVIPRLIRW